MEIKETTNGDITEFTAVFSDGLTYGMGIKGEVTDEIRARVRRNIELSERLKSGKPEVTDA